MRIEASWDTQELHSKILWGAGIQKVYLLREKKGISEIFFFICGVYHLSLGRN